MNRPVNWDVIVEDRGSADQLDVLLSNLERARERDGVGRDGMRVQVRVAVARVDRPGERLDGILEVELVAL